MGMLAYVILRRSYLVNEQNAMVNLKNDMVKTSRYRTIKKKIPSILALKKLGLYSSFMYLVCTACCKYIYINSCNQPLS